MKGYARIDLLGGTIDLWPINMMFEQVITLNAAISLATNIDITRIPQKKIIILDSQEYKQRVQLTIEELNNFECDYGPLTFAVNILQLFDWSQYDDGVSIKISSTIPASSGLGGSTVMGVTLCKALHHFFSQEISPQKLIRTIMDVEGAIISQPPGYQDGYPAVYGGILALHAQKGGEVKVEQLLTPSLKLYLENNMTLIYSGVSRNSGINNWQVFKNFFDKDVKTKQLLKEIASLSAKAYRAILKEDYPLLLDLMMQEGAVRSQLAPQIVTPAISNELEELRKEFPRLGLKMCGAGGGGCYLLLHPHYSAQSVRELAIKRGLKILDLEIQSL